MKLQPMQPKTRGNRVYRAMRTDCGPHGMLTDDQAAKVAGVHESTIGRRRLAGITGAALVAPAAHPQQPPRAPAFFDELHLTGDAPRIETAFRIAFRYGMKLPTIQQLRNDFGMGRATAYRWLAAIRNAKGITTDKDISP